MSDNWEIKKNCCHRLLGKPRHILFIHQSTHIFILNNVFHKHVNQNSNNPRGTRPLYRLVKCRIQLVGLAMMQIATQSVVRGVISPVFGLIHILWNVFVSLTWLGYCTYSVRLLLVSYVCLTFHPKIIYVRQPGVRHQFWIIQPDTKKIDLSQPRFVYKS